MISWKCATDCSSNQGPQASFEMQYIDKQYGPTPSQSIGMSFESYFNAQSFVTSCEQPNSNAFPDDKENTIHENGHYPVWTRLSGMLKTLEGNVLVFKT